MNKVELLAPAGNLEKLKMAILYGADAVYFAGQAFGLRSASDNFSLEEMHEGVAFCHERGKKAYLTMNIIPHNEDLKDVPAFLTEAAKSGIDAVIVSDPGMFALVKKHAPELSIHISTQANITNIETVLFWKSIGASRVVLARELSLKEIRQIKDNIPDDMELEAFVHGAMCMSYSGRCLLSNFLTGRDANKGDCSHPCRWKYHVVEEKRPGEYFPIEEDDRGTFVFNSKDLCMIEHIPELVESGITSFKIEGRVKSSFYVATIVKAYREAIDAYYNGQPYDPKFGEEVAKVSNRDFTTGFFFKKPDAEDHNYGTSSYNRGFDFIGLVTGYDETNGLLLVEQRNRFSRGDAIEILSPEGPATELVVERLLDKEGNDIAHAPHAQMELKIPASHFPVGSILRKKSKN